MALILSTHVEYLMDLQIQDVSPYGFRIQFPQLREPYSLTRRTFIKGVVEDISPLESNQEKEAFQKIKYKELDFSFIPSILWDYLYFSKDSWKLIVELGFVELYRYIFVISLQEIYDNNKKIKIFPLRNVTNHEI